MPKKSLDTLVDDIYNLFDPEYDHECSESNLEEFAHNLVDLVRVRLKAAQQNQARPIRFSSLGKPDRQVWFDAHPIEGGKEKLLPKTYLKFLYGDVIEQVLLLLAKESGHDVRDFQKQVELDGITGSIDAVIDDTVVDVKSASPFGFKKFATDTVTSDDPFGYVAQLSGYADILTPGKEAAWLAMDKVDGEICISKLSPMVIKHHKPDERISHLKEVVESETPPERCYEDVPDGKSGNRKLATGCSYCAHKFRCWPNLRGFAYSTGPRYLTVVAKTPDVPEIVA